MILKDAELIQQVLQGNPEAFGCLVKKYQKGVHTLAWRKIGDFHIAQEITQDAFLKAYQKLGTLKNHNLFAGWLYVIASHLCSDWHRKHPQPLESLETLDDSEMEQMPYSRYMAEKQATQADETRREIVKKLLQKLPESERTVITLYYFGEMTSEAIGEFLGVSANTVRSRLSRARNRLKKEEDMIRQSLDSFQLSAYLTEDIMRKISRTPPVKTSANKPVRPWVISAASAVIIFLLIGVGTQYLSRFQKPYNLNATSEPTVEIIEARFILDASAKPAARNQAGNSVTPGKSPGVGQKPDAPLFAAVVADEAEIPTPKPQWIQAKGPEGGRVLSLFETTSGDIYAGTAVGLYRLTAGKRAWKLITSDAPSVYTAYTQIGWWPMTEHRDTLYYATDTEVLASTDRGGTWNALGTHPKDLPIDIVVTDSVSGAETDIAIYLALNDGIYLSEDSGESWIPLKDGLGGEKNHALAVVENSVFAGTDDGLYRRNGGTWEQLSLTQADRHGQKLPVYALAVAGHRLYAAVGKQFTSQVGMQVKATMIGDTWWSLYRSTDLGDTWYAVNPRKKVENEKMLKDGSLIEFSKVITNLENGRSGSEINLKSHIKIFASGAKVMVSDKLNLFYSVDTGETWFSLNLQGMLKGRWYALPVMMLDAKTFYIGGATGVHRTTDGGESWHQFNTGIVSTDVTNLVAANGKLYAETTDGIVSSTDGGESWTLLSIGGIDNITGLAKFDGSVYVRGEKKMAARFFRLSAEDDRFTAILGVPTFERVNLDEQEWLQEWLDKRQYSFWNALTEEAKQNFKVDEPIDFEDYDLKKLRGALDERYQELDKLIALGRSGKFAVSGETYYVEHNRKLFRWKPGTTEWSDTRLTDGGKPTSGEDSDSSGFRVPGGLKLAASGRTVYAGKEDGELFQSFDEGDTWNNVTANLPFPISRFKIIAFAGSILYVATDKGVIYSSDGTDWHETADVDGAMLVIDKFAVDGTTVYGISDSHAHPARHVYQLKKDANTWKQVTPEIPNRVTSLVVAGKTLYIGTIGRGVLRFTLTE